MDPNKAELGWVNLSSPVLRRFALLVAGLAVADYAYTTLTWDSEKWKAQKEADARRAEKLLAEREKRETEEWEKKWKWGKQFVAEDGAVYKFRKLKIFSSPTA